MLHTNQAELNQLYGTFCRVWAAGGQATLITTSSGGKVTAKLELELGSLSTNTFSGVGATILAIEGLLLRLSLEHQPNSLILKRLQLLLHQKELILQSAADRARREINHHLHVGIFWSSCLR